MIRPKRDHSLILAALLLLAGCRTPPPQAQTPVREFPSEALITQRAVLTARGHQFALNGYLSIGPGGKRLVITENFGQTIADVLVKPDGAVYVMRSSRMVRPAWIRRFVASDLQCVFGGTPGEDCPVKEVDANHYLIERRWYKLDLRIIATAPGPQASQLFDPTGAEKP